MGSETGVKLITVTVHHGDKLVATQVSLRTATDDMVPVPGRLVPAEMEPPSFVIN